MKIYRCFLRAAPMMLALCLCLAPAVLAEETAAEHVHQWGEWTVTVPATCEAAGEETRVCLDDPTHMETRVLPATGHSWGEWVVTLPAGCETAGMETSTCANDPAHVETRAIPALGHAPAAAVRGNEIAPTCAEEGSYDEIIFCEVCGQELSRATIAVPALPHTAGDAVRENETAPGCETEGSYDEAVYCQDCGAELSRVTVAVPALGHSWSEWVLAVPATCEEEGMETSVCLNDESHVETRAVSALGHTPDAPMRIREIAPTCEAAGSCDEIVFCIVCGQELSCTTVELPATGHDAVQSMQYLSRPTCEEQGLRERVSACQTCGKVLARTRENWGMPTGHELTLVAAVTPTPGADGSREYYVCALCGKWFKDAEGTLEITDPASVTVRAENLGELGKNRGMLLVNQGTVKENHGTIVENFGLIAQNLGTVEHQYYRIVGDFANTQYTLTAGSGIRLVEDELGCKVPYLEAECSGVLVASPRSGKGTCTVQASLQGEPLAVQRLDDTHFQITAPPLPDTVEGFVYNIINVTVEIAGGQ